MRMSETELLSWAKQQSPVPVRQLVRMLGINLREYQLPDSQSAYIVRNLNNSFTIGVNTNEGDQRQRFSIAHELGHFYLHRDLLKPGGKHADRLFGGGANPLGPLSRLHERQANQFAAETLLPEFAVKRMWRGMIGDVDLIARQFQVSRVATRWRLVNLGLATKEAMGLA